MEEYMDLVKANRPEFEPLDMYSSGSEMDDLYMWNNGVYLSLIHILEPVSFFSRVRFGKKGLLLGLV